ncbi:MAG: hypothetical protein ISS72_09415 [Candidatus Brocadiae bacterium]|nr:hypothetical protein [Candidatus Brocadiia bacterium]
MEESSGWPEGPWQTAPLPAVIAARASKGGGRTDPKPGARGYDGAGNRTSTNREDVAYGWSVSGDADGRPTEE